MTLLLINSEVQSCPFEGRLRVFRHFSIISGGETMVLVIHGVCESAASLLGIQKRLLSLCRRH